MTTYSPGRHLRVFAAAIIATMVAALVFAISPAPAEAQAAGGFACQVDESGNLSWTDDGVSKYWVYRSDDGGDTYNWIGRTLGEVEFTDSNAPAGALYQVHYQGIPRVNCDAVDNGSNGGDGEPGGDAVIDDGIVIDGEDGADGESVITIFENDNGEIRSIRIVNGTLEGDGFACVAINDTIYWTDDAVSKYWVYRSVDGGETYNWIGRTLGETNFVDANAVDGALYQVHYQGIPRFDCDSFGSSAFAGFDFDFDFGNPL